MAGGPGFEPGPGDPESPRLPLADPPETLFTISHLGHRGKCFLVEFLTKVGAAFYHEPYYIMGLNTGQGNRKEKPS